MDPNKLKEHLNTLKELISIADKNIHNIPEFKNVAGKMSDILTSDKLIYREPQFQDWIIEEAKHSPCAQNIVGNMYFNPNGFEENFIEALNYYKLSAKNEYLYAYYNIGCMYRDGHGVTKDYNEAIKWFKISAMKGSTQSQIELGHIHYKCDDFPQNKVKAFGWYNMALGCNDQQTVQVARNMVAYMYRHGHGVTKDSKEAFRLYTLNAEKGNNRAKCSIGIMLEEGDGCTQNIPEAIKMYREVAELTKYDPEDDDDVTQGRFLLGQVYEDGIGVKVDLVEAFRWYKLAAMGSGSSKRDALKRLADMYMKGSGVAKNYEEGFKCMQSVGVSEIQLSYCVDSHRIDFDGDCLDYIVNIIKDTAGLKDRVQKLEEENEVLKTEVAYQPGGKGYEEAKKDAENLFDVIVTKSKYECL